MIVLNNVNFNYIYISCYRVIITIISYEYKLTFATNSKELCKLERLINGNL